MWHGPHGCDYPCAGGKLVNEEVEKILRGDVYTAVLKVREDVCLHCGERLYSQEIVISFEEIRRKLEHKEVADFQHIG
ncbi:MAG: YgiT-type zinc finger protein [Candidatus Methanoperedens sp.]|uniref:YgiT-type zinc finger protein n=1 Tax=Candidatus Methanoperedens nitratireducens TaxID=1392998 RepID=UPI00064F3678|nr:YgiT-type zinc finger protein [Candidatus Methanoperedens nitroreducens]MDJ1421858.1 YgiT-type zinc finger protein [Candidatus Methanoperedens sp.]